VSSHVLHLGDCLRGLMELPDRSVDHVLSDPPYEAEAHTKQRRTKETGAEFAKVVECPLNFAPISGAERVQIAREMGRIARRWVIVFCQAEAVQAWREALQDGGLVYKRACVWIKPDAMPQLTGDRPGMGYESIVVAHTPGRSVWNGGGRVGVYEFNKNRSDLERTGHPTQKPLALMEALVRDFTDAGDLVCDPYSGSGTTGVACRRLGRSFVGWEVSPDYHAMALQRLAATNEQFGLWSGAA